MKKSFLVQDTHTMKWFFLHSFPCKRERELNWSRAQREKGQKASLEETWEKLRKSFIFLTIRKQQQFHFCWHWEITLVWTTLKGCWQTDKHCFINIQIRTEKPFFRHPLTWYEWVTDSIKSQIDKWSLTFVYHGKCRKREIFVSN